MFYQQYLSSLCSRRQWPAPYYEPYFSTGGGVGCVVRVYNREYHAENSFASEALAKENAAMRAYLICRNFSVNDGRLPSGHRGARPVAGEVLQGLPVAIGKERRSRTLTMHSGYSEDSSDSGSASSPGSRSPTGSRSGGSSPGAVEFPSVYKEERRRPSNARALNYGGRRHHR